MKHKKLFIPGPTEVRREILDVLATPMIGHRSKDFSQLLGEVTPKLQKLFYTNGRVFLSTSSSTGVMEGAVRNCVKNRCLSCVCGAFSDRWEKIARANGKETERLEVEWGKGITADMVRDRLKNGKFDAITLVHNETSTGVMNPLYEIAEVMKEYPDVVFLVDAVSSLAGVKIEVDALGIDVCLAGVQKCFALPPGLAVFSVSDKALRKAREVDCRGYYFDFLEFERYFAERMQTPTTPVISLIYGLNRQLDDMFGEGLEKRFARHKELADYTRKWAKERFDLFADEGFRSNTLTTVTNTRGISVAALNQELAKREVTIANGYGKLKEKTFRIAHMGDLTSEEVKQLLLWIDEIMKSWE
ncbi:aminotransferase [candidate division TA06 bacterium DG_26]|uniref:Aminotransferase n=1 Tax=candidate division TA06 bacterium DG_26 TaxID=1703771 RepID=A0A0S7WMA6_UNCT6|nr:MAG: aminotransferase [candidate division TA06 bacterium DG_26]